MVEKERKKLHCLYMAGTNLCPADGCFMTVCRCRVYVTGEGEKKKKLRVTICRRT